MLVCAFADAESRSWLNGLRHAQYAHGGMHPRKPASPAARQATISSAAYLRFATPYMYVCATAGKPRSRNQAFVQTTPVFQHGKLQRRARALVARVLVIDVCARARSSRASRVRAPRCARLENGIHTHKKPSSVNVQNKRGKDQNSTQDRTHKNQYTNKRKNPAAPPIKAFFPKHRGHVRDVGPLAPRVCKDTDVKRGEANI